MAPLHAARAFAGDAPIRTPASKSHSYVLRVSTPLRDLRRQSRRAGDKRAARSCASGSSSRQDADAGRRDGFNRSRPTGGNTIARRSGKSVTPKYRMAASASSRQLGPRPRSDLRPPPARSASIGAPVDTKLSGVHERSSVRRVPYPDDGCCPTMLQCRRPCVRSAQGFRGSASSTHQENAHEQPLTASSATFSRKTFTRGSPKNPPSAVVHDTTPLHGVRQTGRERPALNAAPSSARLSSSTFTRGSPRKPSCRPSVCSATSARTFAGVERRAPSPRARPGTRAAAGLMCGSRPLPDAVTRSTGTGALLSGSAVAQRLDARLRPPRRAPD